ncbi:SHOCT domain-containing protein [Haloplanus salilacus]|uniref:SHOCT domain-containing protein n=1 Tax=Haloplanus salilacus TaxID=2949994 RepID=UPI0030D561D8
MASDVDTRTLLLVVLAVLVLFPLLGMGTGGGMMMGGPMMYGMGGGMWGSSSTAPGWMVLVGLLGQLLFLAVLVGVGYFLYRALTQSGDTTDGAMEELRLAYARGDLSDDEFEQRRETLERDE